MTLTKTFHKRTLFVGLAIMALLAAFALPASADSHTTFDVSVRHNINGTSLKSLGLSKELPVIVEVWGPANAEIPLSFKDSFEATLPAGTYTIKVFSVELGGFIDSMTLEDVPIPAGADLSIMAKLGKGKTPMLMVR